MVSLHVESRQVICIKDEILLLRLVITFEGVEAEGGSSGRHV
jgi:hypothetical protein